MMNVLIVEDDLSIADLVQRELEADGFFVCGVARTVEEATASAEQHEPDFAVVDIRLANGDLGTDVALNLRVTTNARIMFSTGNTDDISALRKLGDAVMTKPYRMSDLGRGLRIIDEMARLGKTRLAFPRQFELLLAASS